MVWIVSSRTLISYAYSPCTNSLVTVPSVPITNGITVTFMLHSFFSCLERSLYLSLFLLSFSFNVVNRNGNVHNLAGSFLSFCFLLLLTITRSGRLAKIQWSVCISKSQRILCVSFSRTDSGLCIYHLFVWSNLNFLHNSQWITFPTQSCRVLYSFCAYLLLSLIRWLIVSSLSLHNLHLLFCCVLSIFALT